MSDTVVEEVRERADLVELCGEYSKLKRTGRTWRGPCPLHGGEGPNFSVDPGRGIFKCFVCGEGGDVFAFFMKHSGFDFPSAVRHVAARVGIDVPDDAPARPDPYGHLREVAAFAQEWFAERLLDEDEGRRARSYLTSRGFTAEDIPRFGLGFAPAAWRSLRQAAAARGIPEDHLTEIGLLAQSERADEPYDRFRDRLMFTIWDRRGRPIGFGGRALGTGPDKGPKYINSPESPIFKKSEVLFGLNWAQHPIRREEKVLIVEGFLDVLALHRAGFENTVAALGTALTTEQAALVARFGKKAILLYDSDKAGLRATFKAADRLLAQGVHPLVVTLPEGEDPDSVVRSGGPEGLAALIAEAVDVLERKLQILDRGGYLDSIEGKRRALDGILSTLRAVREEALLDLYLDVASDRTGVRRETLVHEIAAERQPRVRVERERQASATRPDVRSRPGPDDSAERTLLLLQVRDPGLGARAAELGVTPAHFQSDVWRALAERLLEREPGVEDGREWVASLPPELVEPAEGLLADPTEIDHAADLFDASARRLLFRQQVHRLDEIDRELTMTPEDGAQARELLREKENLARVLREAGVALSFLRRVSAESQTRRSREHETSGSDYVSHKE
ncbi:MAG: DNA primase [Gemmatimonadota bacterium]